MLLHQQRRPAPPNEENTMIRSIDLALVSRVCTAVLLAGAASALTLGGALLAVVS